VFLLIEGVIIKDLKVIPDERGRLMEILRCDDPTFHGFGQVYITTAYPGVVKAWHYHKKQYDNFTVLVGMMKVALFDDREGSPTRGKVDEFFLGVHNPKRLQIPPGVYHGFKCISGTEALVLNCPTEPYNYAEPDEFRLAPHAPTTRMKIPYDWGRKDG
jgi:dTDP-4-dehydrorhamnose 3,5-epimerase